MAKLILPQNGAKINTQTDIQSTFIEKFRTEGEEKAFEWLLSVKKQRDLSAPREILIEWEPDGAECFAVEISTTTPRPPI